MNDEKFYIDRDFIPTEVFESKYDTEVLHFTSVGTKYLPNEDSEFLGDEDDVLPYMEYVLFVPIT